ncbi:omh4, partial [Symbiodinium necroappetens]
VLLFCVWDFVDAAVRLVETSFKVAAELLQSRSADGCSKESGQGRTELTERSARRSDGAESPTPADPAATSFEEISIDENPLTQRFDRLADGLWLFLDIYDRVRRFGEEEPYDSHAWGLRDFLKEVPEGRRLALLEDTFSLARQTEMSWDTKVTWCTALVASLTFVQQNVSSALELSSSMFLRYRKLMRLEQTFDVPTHLAFLEHVPQWFDEMPVFMNSIGHSRPDRAELLFSRSSRLCTAENSSRLQTSRASSHTSWMPERRTWADSTGYWAWHGHGAATLLEALGSGGRLGSSLSYTFWALRSLDLPEPRCHTQTEVLYDPTACLQEQGWAGYVYMDSARADKTVARYEPRRWKGQRVHPTPFEIQSLRDGVVAPPEPMDVLVGPKVQKREWVVEMLRAESMTISKLVYVAINPLLPPPALAEPNFTTAFAGYWRKSPEQLARGAVAAQCSLASTTEVLRPLSYSLLQVEHLYAVYVHSAFAEMAPDEMKEFEEWRLGWFCSPLSRYLMGLE